MISFYLRLGWIFGKGSFIIYVELGIRSHMSLEKAILGAPGRLSQMSDQLLLRSCSLSPVCEFKPHVGLYADSSEPGAASNSVSFSLCPSSICALFLSFFFKKKEVRGAPGWLSQVSVRLLVSAQVMISQFCGFEPCIRLCMDSTEPA